MKYSNEDSIFIYRRNKTKANRCIIEKECEEKILDSKKGQPVEYR